MVRGGDATITPLLLEKPKVLYTMPIGNNIARNSNVAVAFSTEIDFDTIDLASFQVLKSGIEQVDDGQFFISADGKTVGFNPAGDLAVYSNYVISIGAQVLGVLDLEAYQQGNTILIDDPLQIAGSYTAAFRTGVDLDNIPPVNGAFTVSGYSGDPYYTNNPRVTLSDIDAEDDAGVALVLVKNPADADYLSFSFQNNPTITWSVPFTNGRKDIWMVFEDWNNQRTPDLSKVVRTIAVDSTAPTGTISVNGYSGGVPEFIDTATVILTLSASDADVEAGVKGSGESTNGTDTANRKQMRFANSSGAVASASWEAYVTSRAGWSLGAATEGSRTVYAQFRDAVGNESPIYSDGIYLDVTAPTGSFALAGGGIYTNTKDIDLAVTASDGSGSGLDTLQLKTDSGLQPSSPWSAGAASGTLDGSGASAAFPYNSTLTVDLPDTARDEDRQRVGHRQGRPQHQAHPQHRAGQDAPHRGLGHDQRWGA